jgi:hypothetical protein
MTAVEINQTAVLTEGLTLSRLSFTHQTVVAPLRSIRLT